MSCPYRSLPDVESTPLLVIRLTTNASDRLVELLMERIHQEGFIVLSNFVKADGRFVLSITARHDSLEETAEEIHLVKKTNDGIMERFTIQDRHRFVQRHPSHTSPLTTCVIFDKFGLFTATEWSLLILRRWQRTRAESKESISYLHEDDDKCETNLCWFLQSEYGVRCNLHLDTEPESLARMSVKGIKTLKKYQDQSAYLGTVLRTAQVIDSVTSIHLPFLRDQVLSSTLKWNQLCPDVDLIQSYYGCGVAFYFAWTGFLSYWLIFPGFAGVVVCVMRLQRGDTVNEDEYTPFYGILAFFWAVLLLRFWQRHERRLSFKWGTYLLTDYERQKLFSTRQSFHGYLRLSPITKKPEVYYPTFRRRLKYVGSAVLTIVMLSIAFFVMILSLNLQGYIHPKSKPSRWNELNPHPFHFPSFAILAEKGGVFDSTSWCRALIPSIIHAACVNALNTIYRAIAESLTTWENHEDEMSHKNSYALKRFLFEAFDCYVSLFYLAFYERDVERLRVELMTLFQIDIFRRLGCECLIPMLKRRTGLRFTSEITNSSRYKCDFSSVIPCLQSILVDLEKEPYDEFDDYMETLIQFGYVTLFASAYPLASIFSLVSIWVEMRADLFKLSFIDQRPFPTRSSDLGIWRSLLSILVWMSALTNCLLVGFSSDQLVYYLPSFYLQDRKGDTSMAHDRAWLLIFVIFGLERVLLVVAMAVYVAIPEIPEDIANELERRHYVHAQRYHAKQKHVCRKKDY